MRHSRTRTFLFFLSLSLWKLLRICDDASEEKVRRRVFRLRRFSKCRLAKLTRCGHGRFFGIGGGVRQVRDLTYLQSGGFAADFLPVPTYIHELSGNEFGAAQRECLKSFARKNRTKRGGNSGKSTRHDRTSGKVRENRSRKRGRFPSGTFPLLCSPDWNELSAPRNRFPKWDCASASK